MIKVESLRPYFNTQPVGYDCPATFYLTMNRTKANNTWSAGYQDYATGLVLLAVNNCETLEEVALRLGQRLERFMRSKLPRPRSLQDLPNSVMVSDANLTEGIDMADETNTKLTYGGKAVGLSFNPSNNVEVDDIKKASANFIDTVCGPSGEKLDFGQGKDNEAASMRKLAMRSAQEAQMWAVKAATWTASDMPTPPASADAGSQSDPQANNAQ